MNSPVDAAHTAESGLQEWLLRYRALCEEALVLYREEQRCLLDGADYPAFLFYQRRNDLLPRLEQALTGIRRWRGQWSAAEGGRAIVSAELRNLTDQVQTMLMRILQLDRENQQALLGRGLLPARQWPKAAAQKPHYVADLYRRHCSV